MFNQRFNILCSLVNISRKGYFSFKNVPVNSHGIIITERIYSYMHLIKKYPQCPPIDSFSMTLVQDYFRSDVLRGTTDGEGSAFVENFCKSEVSQFQVTIWSDQQVLWFKIPKYDIFVVKVLKTQGNNPSIESTLFSWQILSRPKIGKKFSTINKLKHKIEISGILCNTLKTNNKRMIDLRMYKILIINMVDLLSLYDLTFFQEFESNISFMLVFVLLAEKPYCAFVVVMFLPTSQLHFSKSSYIYRYVLPRPIVLPTQKSSKLSFLTPSVPFLIESIQKYSTEFTTHDALLLNLKKILMQKQQLNIPLINPFIYNSDPYILITQKMLKIINIPIYFCTKVKPTRTLIIPQQFTTKPLQQYFHINSNSYDFLTTSNPSCSQIYVHGSDTPSSLLKKNAIHIFPDSVPQQSINQKYKAHLKKLEQDYKKSFDKCKTPAQVFHLDRRIKTDIRQRCKFIGKVTGKYKHYNLFKSINQLSAQRTLQEYKKNGVSVSLLGKNKIFPQGPVWLPTTDAYLKLFQQSLLEKITTKPSKILDLGCGSGILSFFMAKSYKNSTIYAVDNNKHAIETTSVNAANFGLQNIQTLLADITKQQDFQHKLSQKRAPTQFDLIVSNPPWLIAKRNKYESQILDGVYDNKGQFLISTVKIANKHLKDKNSRYLLIYSDLSQILGIQTKSIDELCKQNNFLVHSKLEAEYPKPMEKQSPLSPYKVKSKIQLYEIGRS